jgi:hypothetical protein
MQNSRTSACFRRLRIAVAFLILCLFPLSGGATANNLTTPHFAVAYDDIDGKTARDFAHGAETAYSAIVDYLGRHSSRPIRLTIGKHILFPLYDRDSGEVFVPANRVREYMDISTRIRKRGPGLMLVLTPVIAPSANRQWGDFVETGLRVFLQEKLERSDIQSFPTMGRDLHEETAALASDYGRLIPIAEVEKARTWRTKLTRTRRLAYLEAGSFVRFLIERHGLEKFLRWYDGGQFDEVYQRKLAEMEREWGERIRARRP